MMNLAFSPVGGKSFAISNATSSASGVLLPVSCKAVALTNTSATATAYVRITSLADTDTSGGTAATTTTDMPVLPGTQIRIGVPVGNKAIRTIASAADGNVIVTPGEGI